MTDKQNIKVATTDAEARPLTTTERIAELISRNPKCSEAPKTGQGFVFVGHPAKIDPPG